MKETTELHNPSPKVGITISKMKMPIQSDTASREWDGGKDIEQLMECTESRF